MANGRRDHERSWRNQEGDDRLAEGFLFDRAGMPGNYGYDGDVLHFHPSGAAPFRDDATSEPRPRRHVPRSDSRVHEDVCEALADHPHIDARDIEVRVEDGEVTLTGHVNDRYSKRLCEDIVTDIGGVRDVINLIRIARTHSSTME